MQHDAAIRGDPGLGSIAGVPPHSIAGVPPDSIAGVPPGDIDGSTGRPVKVSCPAGVLPAQ